MAALAPGNIVCTHSVINTLFAVAPILPKGFTYIPDFISQAEEASLHESISKIDLYTFMFQGYEAKRKVASFGYDYSFDHRQLSKGIEIPVEFSWLIRKVAIHLSIEPAAFSELLITEYPPGAVINWHRDAPPFGVIAGISLCSDCIFKLRPHDKAKQNRKAIISVPVRRRSLYVISGEARQEWEHSIRPVETPRYSITLRTLRM